MKRKILVTVSYVVEIEKDEFWDRKTGHLTDEIEASLKKRFPQKAKLTNKISSKRESLCYMMIDHPNTKILTCPICKHLMVHPNDFGPVPIFHKVVEVEGALLCHGCAWELDLDIKQRGIDSVLEELR